MSTTTTRIGLLKPETGEPDLASDVSANMDIIDATALTAEQFDSLTSGSATALHTHSNIGSASHAETSGRLSPGATINGVVFDGSSPVTVTAAPRAHTHATSDLTGVDPSTQLRRIFVGTSADPSTVDTAPQAGDLYIRIR